MGHAIGNLNEGPVFALDADKLGARVRKSGSNEESELRQETIGVEWPYKFWVDRDRRDPGAFFVTGDNPDHDEV